MSDVFALKYRPEKFSKIIGQERTISQLQNSIRSNRLGHAFIFCGTRGTGKTTTARVLAKRVNCQAYPYAYDMDSPDADDPYSVTIAKEVFGGLKAEEDPCNDCMSCNQINNGSHPSVTEVDAASNTGVDNVRELIENIRYSTWGRRRVIILDEAHMLSKNAFNSLLKTLEDPGKDVIFILCTTEPHKLLPTVRSRCQQYEFGEVTVENLFNYYKEISENESLNHSDEVLQRVALQAQGSVRDGLSALFKMICNADISYEDNTKDYFSLVSAIYQGDATTALAVLKELRKTEDARIIIQSLENWFYHCSLESFGMKTPVRDYFEGDTLTFDLEHLQGLFDTCLEIERSFTATPNSKIVLEMGIIKLTL